ncbi:hypothetical protein D9758_007185 [Tetrapyrgos nigripes]|uniref:Mediator of RNA polymerase II transcription subunit 10 n=1 Tax=Tetrapyrgos nigripes TaxID=182062 RepID=A0A8H5D0P2_9AGAR|nr:hypothetical protein D9758_007185 [Tetrapyrgos nigripes]
MASPPTPLAQELDSPRSSPAPAGIQHDLEVDLMALASALYSLGTTIINDSTKDGEKHAGQRVNDVIETLRKVDERSRDPDLRTMVPMQILLDIDNAKNPMNVTRERLERAATENQFMNGKIKLFRAITKPSIRHCVRIFQS